MTFEEKAGLVPVAIEKLADGSIRCELTAPQPLSLGKALDPAEVAAAVSLQPEDVSLRAHAPRAASVGLPFLMVELVDLEALERARSNASALEVVASRGVTPDIHLYVRTGDEFDVRARMFAPLDGVPEDPATRAARTRRSRRCSPRSIRRPTGNSATASRRESRWGGRASWRLVS